MNRLALPSPLRLPSVAACAALTIAALSPAARAAITYLDQSRIVVVTANTNSDAGDDSESDDTHNTDPFDADVRASVVLGPAVAAAHASQRSELLPAGIHTAGVLDLSIGDFQAGEQFVQANSYLTVIFRLDRAYDYEAHATASPDVFGVSSRVALEFFPDGRPLFLSEHGESSPGVPVAAGVLEAGDYVFHADFLNRINFGTRDLAYAASLDLTPHEAGPGPTPIPLQPAARPALVTAAIVALAPWMRRRRRDAGAA